MNETAFTPRFSETDAMGHIGNTVVPVWFESARRCIFEAIHPAMTLEDWPLIVAHYSIDFRRQIFLGSEVTVKTGVEKLGNSSMTVYQQVWQEQQLAAEGRTIMVYFDYKQHKSIPIPETARERLVPLMVAP